MKTVTVISSEIKENSERRDTIDYLMNRKFSKIMGDDHAAFARATQ